MLTKRQMEILRIMDETDDELVQDGIQVWLGDIQVHPRTVTRLLEHAALKDAFTITNDRLVSI